MQLGLYVCSFYFHQRIKGQNDYIWNLNAPIKYEDHCFPNALAFFKSFCDSHKETQDLEDEQKLYFIETNDAWFGENDEFHYFMFQVHSGAYGIQADIYDKNNKKYIGKRSKDHADVIPFLCYVVIPKTPPDNSPVNKGILFFQSTGVYGIKSCTSKLINDFARDMTASSFQTRNVSPDEFLKTLFENSNLRKLRLIRNYGSRDLSDSLGPNYSREERVISKFHSAPAISLFERLVHFGLSRGSLFEWDDGHFYDQVKVEVDFGNNRPRTIDLRNISHLSILEYIPNIYTNANGHADSNSIIPYFTERATYYIQRLCVTMNSASKKMRIQKE